MWYWGFLSRLLDCLYVAHARSAQDTAARYRNQVNTFKRLHFIMSLNAARTSPYAPPLIGLWKGSGPLARVRLALLHSGPAARSDIQRTDRPLLIFPEGTTTNGRCMGTYLKLHM